MKARFALLILWSICSTFASTAQSQNLDLIRGKSSVTYRLVHPLHKIEATSKDVAYQLDTDVTTKEIRRVSAQVDVTTFDSGNSNRDSHAMEVIDALTYPEASFASTSITQIGDSLRVAGKLSFHGITRDAIMPAVAAWTPGTLEVRGDFDVTLSEFNIDRPSLLMIPVEDRLSFSVVAVFSWK